MRISPSDMLLFVDVVQQASFTAAAMQQGISKQAVSERIGRLEAALGVRLLQRTTRSLRTTEAGERYYTECAQIAHVIEQANQTLQTEQAEPVGKLVVSAPILYGRGKLIPAIKAFTQRYPKVQLDLRLSDSLVNLVGERIDVALRVSHLNDSALSVRRLGAVSAYFVASPALLIEFEGKNDAEIVRAAPAVTLRDNEIWDLPQGAKIKPKSVLTVNDLSAISSAAVAGMGIARLPGIECKPLVAQGSLKMLLDGQPANSFTVYAVYVSKKQLAPKIRAFIDTLVEHRTDFTDGE
jgi:DNA-binding transcriptional LysR family regulator